MNIKNFLAILIAFVLILEPIVYATNGGNGGNRGHSGGCGGNGGNGGNSGSGSSRDGVKPI